MNSVRIARAKWVDALRSGKYKQTRSALRYGDAYCCLGVACDVLGDGKWDATPMVDWWEFWFSDGQRKAGDLPPSMLDRLGLSTDDQRVLMDLNDNGVSFDAIATHIERLPL